MHRRDREDLPPSASTVEGSTIASAKCICKGGSPPVGRGVRCWTATLRTQSDDCPLQAHPLWFTSQGVASRARGSSTCLCISEPKCMTLALGRGHRVQGCFRKGKSQKRKSISWRKVRERRGKGKREGQKGGTGKVKTKEGKSGGRRESQFLPDLV